MITIDEEESIVWSQNVQTAVPGCDKGTFAAFLYDVLSVTSPLSLNHFWRSPNLELVDSGPFKMDGQAVRGWIHNKWLHTVGRQQHNQL